MHSDLPLAHLWKPRREWLQSRGLNFRNPAAQVGYPCLSLHGGKDQSDRESTINDFKSDVCNLLVATGVAARGLDVKELVLVVNYDTPNHHEEYVHRVGRTGAQFSPVYKSSSGGCFFCRLAWFCSIKVGCIISSGLHAHVYMALRVVFCCLAPSEQDQAIQYDQAYMGMHMTLPIEQHSGHVPGDSAVSNLLGVDACSCGTWERSGWPLAARRPASTI